MSKTHKKRVKRYSGDQISSPTVKVTHRYTAVIRSPLGEWWHAHKRRSLTIAVVVVGAALVIWLITDAIRSLTGS